MKKLKFLPCILMLVLCVGVLAIGIYAITPSQNTIDGTITVNASNLPVKITVLKDGEPIIAEHEVRYGKEYSLDDILPNGLAFETDEANDKSEVASIKLTFRIKNISTATSGTDAFANETVGAFFTAGNVVMGDNELADGTNDIKTTDTIMDETDPVANVKLDTYTPIVPNETVDMTITFTIADIYDDEKNGDIDYNLYIEKYAPTTSDELASAKLVKLPVTLETINNSTFSGVTKANVEYVSIPSSVTTIADGSTTNGAFVGFSSLKEVRLPDEITEIGSYAFYNNTALASIKLPSSLTLIDDRAFYGCSALTELDISNCTSIPTVNNGYYAFYNCNNLNKLNIAESQLATLCSTTYSAYDSNILSKAKNLYINNKLVRELVVPSTVESIGAYAFVYCESLTSIIMPEELTSIGNNAFYVCGNLTSIIMPEELTSIGNRAFFGCAGLTSIIIPEGVSRIGSSTFSSCTGLRSITIPNSVTAIGADAFSNCSSLKNVKYESNKENYTYKDGVLTITTALTTDTNPAWLTDNMNPLIFSVKWNSVATENTTIIPSRSFHYSYNLTDITIPENVESIGTHAFNDCFGLTSMIIPKKVTSIGYCAFEDCVSLSNVILPNSLYTINCSAFGGCDSLKEIYIPECVQVITSYHDGYCGNYEWVFDGCNEELIIKCGASEKPDEWPEDWNWWYDSEWDTHEFDVEWGVENPYN